jgi:DNA-binding beta-propeller fold protein YncE
MKKIHLVVAPVIGLLVAIGCSQPMQRGAAPQGVAGGPKFVVDPFWPKPLPNNWTLGQVSGLATDNRGHIWLIHRPATIAADEKGAAANPSGAKCCIPAPPVIELDAAGNVVQAWGGPGSGYDWQKNEHGIYVDPADNVWVGGNDAVDHQLLKFTRDGKFLMQIGRPGKSEGSNSRTQLGRPAHMELDTTANELYVADGYGNKRVVVFDASTGQYKRHWGAYGKAPDDAKLPAYNPESPQFANPVHCVRLARDGLVYVCDRSNNRIQVFRKDGTYVRQFPIEPKTLINGSVHDMILSPDPLQSHLFVADGSNGEVHIVERESGKRVASFGRLGRYAGQFYGLHNIAVDARGNIYTAEVRTGKRVQKFSRAD